MDNKVPPIALNGLKSNPYIAEMLKKIRGAEDQPAQNGTAAFLALGNGQPNSCWEAANNNPQIS